jgi:hypothetical protein
MKIKVVVPCLECRNDGEPRDRTYCATLDTGLLSADLHYQCSRCGRLTIISITTEESDES